MRKTAISTAIVMALLAGGYATYKRVEPSTKRPHVYVSCPKESASTVVIATFGQSNAGNHGGGRISKASAKNTPYQPSKHVFAFDWLSGQCVQASEPIWGADGDGESVWGRLGDQLIQREDIKNVVFIAFAVGETSIDDWIGRPGGREYLPDRINKISDSIKSINMRIDFILFQQGESDKEKTHVEYSAKLKQLTNNTIRLLNAPMFVAVSTVCQAPENLEIAKAIMDSVDEASRVMAGPNFDRDATHTLDRTDQCHFSQSGLDKAARLWMKVLTPYLAPPYRKQVAPAPE